MIIEIKDEKEGLEGYVVVDTFVQDSSCGGMRVAENLTLEEVRNLARGMTRKYAFMLDSSIGGGKAGISIPYHASEEKKEMLIGLFAEKIAPIVRKGLFLPLADMNIREKDLRLFYSKVGMPMGAYIDSGEYTGMSVYNACKAVLDKDDSIRHTVAIEGFGSVGSSLASFLQEEDVSIVAVSTALGAIYNHKGLDIRKLCALQKQYGDSFVYHYSPVKPIRLGALLELNVDILSQCARPFSINEANCRKVKARYLIPGANDPIAFDVYGKLHDMGIVALPDFICNAGGTGGSFMDMEGVEKDEIFHIFASHFRPVVSAIMRQADLTGLTPYDIALRLIENRKTDKASGREKGWHLERFIKGAYFKMAEKGLIPRNLKANRATRAIKKNMKRAIEVISDIRQ